MISQCIHGNRGGDSCGLCVEQFEYEESLRGRAWAAERRAETAEAHLNAFIASLPRCCECSEPATRMYVVSRFCDVHATDVELDDLPYARVLRAIARTEAP